MKKWAQTFFLFSFCVSQTYSQSRIERPTVVLAPEMGSNSLHDEPGPPEFVVQTNTEGTRFIPTRATAGIRIAGNGSPTGALALSVSAGEIRSRAVGQLRALTVDAVYVPNAGGFRVRVTGLDIDVAFFCRTERGNISGPLVGLFNRCRAHSIVGISGSVLQSQYDTEHQRSAVRWFDIGLALNLLANAGTPSWLSQRLQLDAGVSLDTIWPGSLPGVISDPHHPETVGRAHLGISGLFVTNDQRWEFRGYVGARPNLAAWDNWIIQTRSQIIHHLPVNTLWMINFGFDLRYDYSTVPRQSVGFFSSDRDPHSIFLGAFFEVPFFPVR